MNEAANCKPTPKMYDVWIEKKSMYPLWIFTDVHQGKFVGGKFLCFVGANYDPGLVSPQEDPHKYAVERLKNGTWKLAEKQANKDPEAKIGWGFGNTPTEAFQAAMKSAAYYKVQDTTKNKS